MEYESCIESFRWNDFGNNNDCGYNSTYHFKKMTNLVCILLAALSSVESGDCDKCIGKSGELSRYQISPPVMAEYRLDATKLKDYNYATEQARRILIQRMSGFVTRHHRQPTGTEIYLLWHRPARTIHPRKIERARAERLNNLLVKISKTGM